MKATLRPILPRGRGLDRRRAERAIENALTGVAKAAKADFDTTTQTWRGRPQFVIEESPGQRVVGTDDDIYGMLNEGTRPHTIAPKKKILVFKSGYRAKTVPMYIGSRAGGTSGGQVVTRKPVRHPGTAARKWDEAVGRKWERLFPVTMQRAIDAELSRSA